MPASSSVAVPQKDLVGRWLHWRGWGCISECTCTWWLLPLLEAPVIATRGPWCAGPRAVIAQTVELPATRFSAKFGRFSCRVVHRTQQNAYMRHILSPVLKLSNYVLGFLSVSRVYFPSWFWGSTFVPYFHCFQESDLGFLFFFFLNLIRLVSHAWGLVWVSICCKTTTIFFFFLRPMNLMPLGLVELNLWLCVFANPLVAYSRGKYGYVVAAQCMCIRVPAK